MIFGDLERLLAQLYPYRLPIAIASSSFWRPRWDRSCSASNAGLHRGSVGILDRHDRNAMLP